MKYIYGILSFIILAANVKAQTSSLQRKKDPLVLPGSLLPAFTNLDPGQLVAFKFENGVWIQIPLQIDERALTDIVIPYGQIASQAGFPPSPSNPRVLFYCDANTNVGEDTLSTFDVDDELVFMLKDAGGQSNGTIPAGVTNSLCQEITITDPLGGTGYVYLFENAGLLQQSAGANYVSVSSNLLSTPGFPVNINITNAENTTISTLNYSWHFSSEWVADEFKIATGSNVDILDRHKNFFANGNCSRHEDVFSSGENAFLAVKHGPVRSIRSYMGAQSGVLTSRTNIFYEGRLDIITDLRVHNIPAIYDAFDYNSSANGMIYTNNLAASGVVVDGLQDTLVQGDLQWEQLSGVPGTLSIIHERSTTLTSADASFVFYYDDNLSTPASNCTGDGQAWGTSGIGIVFANSNVCTDPLYNACAGTQWERSMQARRILYPDSSNVSSTTAATYYGNLNNTLLISVSGCGITAGTKPNLNNNLLFPNPGNGTFNLACDSGGTVKVIDLLGHVILFHEVVEGNNKIEIADNGIYLLELIRNDGTRTVTRVVVQR